MAKTRNRLNTVLELGTYEMRLLMLESAGSGEIRLKKCLSTQTPKDFVASTYIEFPIIEQEPVCKAIASLIKEAKMPYENCMVMMPDHSTLIDLMVTPPRYSKKEMDDVIKEEFEPIMPMPIDSWHITHQTIGAWEDDEIVLALATVKSNLLEAGGLVQKAGLNPNLMDINFLNVANLAEEYLSDSNNKGKNICLIHLGHESTSIGVFHDGQLRALQNRPIGAYDFTKQISKHFHVPENEADQFKRNEIFFLPEASPEQDGLYNFTVIKNTFASLSREIFGALESYLTKFREFSIHEILISGGGANFENIAVALSSNLNTRVKCISEIYELYVNGSAVAASEKNSLAAACGCFLRE
ncbi:MAG: pilus assembly protein PilM [Candidatus Rifleibacteriota bacterium]